MIILLNAENEQSLTETASKSSAYKIWSFLTNSEISCLTGWIKLKNLSFPTKQVPCFHTFQTCHERIEYTLFVTHVTYLLFQQKFQTLWRVLLTFLNLSNKSVQISNISVVSSQHKQFTMPYTSFLQKVFEWVTLTKL